MPTPVARARFMKLDTKLPALARHRDPAGRRIGRHDLGAQLGRCRHDALAVRAGEQDPELVGERHQLVFGGATGFVPPRRTRPTSGTPRALPCAAHARRISGLAAAGVHTNTRSTAPSGSSAMSATVRTPSTSSPWRLVPKTRPVYPPASRLCSETKPNLPGCDDAPVTSTPRGENRASNCSAVGRGRVAGRSPLPSPSSTRASTATASPSWPTMSGLTSTLATSGRSTARRPSPTSRSTTRSRSTPASPRNGPRSFWVTRSSIISAAVGRSSGAGLNTTSATASARIPPTPSITVGPNWRSRSMPAISSRFPATIGATSNETSPSDGSAASKQLGRGGVARLLASPSRRRTRPRSVLWAIASPHSFTTTGNPIAVAAAAASSALATSRSSANGSPKPARSRFEAASDRVVGGAVEGVVIARNGSEPRSPETGTSSVRQRSLTASGRHGRTRAHGRGATASVSGASVGASSRPSMNGASEK